MTKKLYDENAYQSEFIAEVMSCNPCQKGYDVLLDQTLFFPEEGGQTCDRGTLNDIEVKDVQIIDQEIHHYVEKPLTGKVKSKIDFAYRYSNMQNHSGEHIISGIVKSLFGYDNNGFHLSDHEITTDYNGYLSHEQLATVEQMANQVVLENHTIHCFYPDCPDDYDYRSKKEINEAIRLVEIEGIDCCACCAPHVQSTSEIGIIKILKAIKNKKGIRIYFVCGHRAYQDYLLKHDQAMYISKQLSLPPLQLTTGIERLIQENNQLKQEISSLKKQMIDSQIQLLHHKTTHIVFIDELDRSLQQYYLNQLSSYSDKLAAVFVGSQDQYRFMMLGEMAHTTLQQLKASFEVKGGGKDIVQGQIIGQEKLIKECIEQSERGK